VLAAALGASTLSIAEQRADQVVWRAPPPARFTDRLPPWFLRHSLLPHVDSRAACLLRSAQWQCLSHGTRFLFFPTHQPGKDSL
jgi:hypothetical protein